MTSPSTVRMSLVGALMFCALLFLTPLPAQAVPILVTGNSTGSQSTASGTLTLGGNNLTLTLLNTSPNDARITGVGFDLVAGDFSGNGLGSGLLAAAAAARRRKK